MKEYYNSFDTTDDYCISVASNKNKVTLGIDIGVDGFYTDLNKKELDLLINMLKEAKKKIIKGGV